MRLIRTMGVGVTALALATSLAGTSSAQSSPTSAASKGVAAAAVAGPNAKTCWSNLEGDTGAANTSQNFEAAFDQYDAQLADDVTLAKKCKVKSITVVGQYSAAGPADSVGVTFYKDKKGKPGKVVSDQDVTGTDNAGSFVLPLKTVKLKAKATYWVSVQVNMDFSVGGQWYWQNTANAIGDPALFKNPGDGFATGCTDWANAQNCFAGSAPGPDYMFALN